MYFIFPIHLAFWLYEFLYLHILLHVAISFTFIARFLFIDIILFGLLKYFVVFKEFCSFFISSNTWGLTFTTGFLLFLRITHFYFFFPNFHIEILTYFRKYKYFSSISFYIFDIHFSCWKLFLKIIVTGLISVAVAVEYITLFKMYDLV